ncbi:MAG: hypothetical protein KDD45_03970, partial [Bdellovibrionales bacterium]|nr:hypothetical protein [Bdellovibrionales bacterium]
TSQVKIKNLINLSELNIKTSKNDILELTTNNSQSILIVEDKDNQKLVSLMSDKKIIKTWPPFSKNCYNFFFDESTQTLNFLEKKNSDTILKRLKSDDSCHLSLFSFAEKNISYLSPSPQDNQTYVWVETEKEISRIKLGTLKINSDINTCKNQDTLGK